MKICFVTESLNEKHGYGRVSVNLIRELSKGGIEGPILTFEKSPVPNDLKNRTASFLKHHPLSPLSFPIDLWKDYRSIVEAAKECDGIHFLTESFLATTIFGYQKPYIVTAYGTWAVNPLIANPISRFIFSEGYKRAKRVVTISNETRKRLSRQLTLPNMCTVSLGVNLTNLSKKGVSRNSGLNILTVAAIHPSKGLDVALKGVIQYSRTNNVHYTIVGGKGEEKYRDQLQSYARKHSFNNLTILQDISDEELIRCYQSADIFILPSVEINGDFEGFGLILLEAFAAEVPVIATRSGAIPEIVIDKVTGILVPEFSHNAIEKALETIAGDSDLKQSLIKNGSRTLNSYSLSNMVNGYKHVYHESFI